MNMTASTDLCRKKETKQLHTHMMMLETLLRKQMEKSPQHTLTII